MILRDPDIIPLINRWGIKLGVGTNTVAEICQCHGIDTMLFCTILNTFVNDNYFPVRNLMECDPPQLVQYLTLTYQSYTHYQLPTIDRHFDMLMQRSGNDNNLAHLRRFFNEMKQQILGRIAFDMEQWFPAIAEGRHIEVPESTDINEQLSDIKHMLVSHLEGNYDTNLCYAVITVIFSLCKDMLKNNRLRDRILRAITCPSTPNADSSQSTPLSAREIEVLRLVALGRINKEIAAELGISFNTVLTHRRNITAKLGIRSVSGLGAYALTRGYITEHQLS